MPPILGRTLQTCLDLSTTKVVKVVIFVIARQLELYPILQPPHSFHDEQWAWGSSCVYVIIYQYKHVLLSAHFEWKVPSTLASPHSTLVSFPQSFVHRSRAALLFFVNDPLFSEFFLSKQFANEYVNSTFSLSSSKPNKSKYLVENVH